MAGPALSRWRDVVLFVPQIAAEGVSAAIKANIVWNWLRRGDQQIESNGPNTD